jgi:hypothetical protein
VGAVPFFLFFKTQTMHIKSMVRNSIAMPSKKTYTLAGFEPGTSVPEANVTYTLRHDARENILIFL